MAEVKVYESFATMPLDDPPGFEGDDSISFADRGGFRALAAHAAEKPAVHKLVVPYPGELHPGALGDSVYGIKRMVHRSDSTLWALQATPLISRKKWGRPFTRKLKKAQARAGLSQTGVWDRPTHTYFAPFADSYAIALIHEPRIPDPSPQDIQRNVVISFLMAFYNRRYNVRYDQARPSQLLPVRRITRADCSGSVACAMWTGKVLPKVDWRWTNTDTQIHFGAAVGSLSQAKVCDVAFYGHGTDPSHESCVVSIIGHDVRVFSFGSYPARILPVDYDRGRLGGRIALRRFIA